MCISPERGLTRQKDTAFLGIQGVIPTHPSAAQQAGNAKPHSGSGFAQAASLGWAHLALSGNTTICSQETQHPHGQQPLHEQNDPPAPSLWAEGIKLMPGLLCVAWQGLQVAARVCTRSAPSGSHPKGLTIPTEKGSPGPCPCFQKTLV